MINYTLQQTLTTECFKWCQVQHYNYSIQSLWIVATAFILLFIYYLLLHYYYKINDILNVDVETTHKLLTILPKVTLWLLLAFMVYELYF